MIIGCGAWAYFRPRLPRWRWGKTARIVPQSLAPAALPAPQAKLAEALFGRAALLRALVVFNAIFAVQTLLDAAYLWGGVALPDGLSYAAYAHRGAYPLIVTALLAAEPAGLDAAGQRDIVQPADPWPGLSLGRAECGSGAVVDPAA